METAGLILACSLWGLDYASPIVAYFWEKRRNKTFWPAICTSFTVTFGWVFVINGTIGCILAVPSALRGQYSFSFMFVNLGSQGVFCAGLGFATLLAFLSIRALAKFLPLTATAPIDPPPAREPQPPVPASPFFLPSSPGEASAERESQCNP